MKLRRLRRADIDSCAAIAGRNYPRKWEAVARRELAAMFADVAIKPMYWVAEDRGEVIAFGGYCQSWIDYGVYGIFWVNVAPDRQNRGVGGALVGKLLAEVRRQRGAHLVEIIVVNRRLERYYRKRFGFRRARAIGPASEREYLMLLSLDG